MIYRRVLKYYRGFLGRSLIALAFFASIVFLPVLLGLMVFTKL